MTGLLTGIQGKPALAAVLDQPPSGTDIDNILTSLPPALYIMLLLFCDAESSAGFRTTALTLAVYVVGSDLYQVKLRHPM